jgi:hypothetical protein
MKILLLAFLMPFGLLAQSHSKNLLSFSAGHTFMGSGDLRGFNVGFGFQKQFFKHFAVETNIRASSASAANFLNQFSLSSANPNTIPSTNSELRFNTSGYQLEILPILPVINSGLKLSILAGPVLRRQYNSKPTSFGISTSPQGNILTIDYQRSFIENSIGFTGQIEAAIKLNKKAYLGGRLIGHSYRGNLNWYFPIVFMHEI